LARSNSSAAPTPTQIPFRERSENTDVPRRITPSKFKVLIQDSSDIALREVAMEAVGVQSASLSIGAIKKALVRLGKGSRNAKVRYILAYNLEKWAEAEANSDGTEEERVPPPGEGKHAAATPAERKTAAPPLGQDAPPGGVIPAAPSKKEFSLLIKPLQRGQMMRWASLLNVAFSDDSSTKELKYIVYDISR
jgi:hypothetical protein